jgi:hypothetical protein
LPAVVRILGEAAADEAFEPDGVKASTAMGGGSAARIDPARLAQVSPWKARRPVTIS